MTYSDEVINAISVSLASDIATDIFVGMARCPGSEFRGSLVFNLGCVVLHGVSAFLCIVMDPSAKTFTYAQGIL